MQYIKKHPEKDKNLMAKMVYNSYFTNRILSLRLIELHNKKVI